MYNVMVSINYGWPKGGGGVVVFEVDRNTGEFMDPENLCVREVI